MKDLKEDVGKAFQGELMLVVGILKSVVAFFKDHTDAIEKFGKGALVLVGIIATITAATKAWALAQGALNLAMAINPAFLLAGGIIGAGAIIYKEYSDMKEGMDARYKQMETDALRKDVGSGKVKIDDLRKRGMTDDQIRELISGRKLEAGESFEGFDTGIKLQIGGKPKPDPEALKLAIEVQKRQRENEQYFKDQSIAATGAGKTGYAKDVAEMNAEIARRTTFTDDKGTHQVALTKSAWSSIIDTMQKKFQAFKDHFALENKKTLADYLKDEEEKHQKEMEYEAKRYQERLKNDVDIAEKNLDHLRDGVRLRGAAGGLRAGRAPPAGGGRGRADAPAEDRGRAAESRHRDRLSGEGPRGEAGALRHGHAPDAAGGGVDAQAARLQGRRDHRADRGVDRPAPGDPRPGRRGERRRDPGGARERRQPDDAVGARPQPADLRLAQAAGGRRVRRAPDQVAVGVEGHRQLAQDRAPDGHQGRGHVAGRGHADVDVHRPEGDVRGRRRGAWR